MPLRNEADYVPIEQIKPRHDFVLLQRFESKAQINGLHVPDTAKPQDLRSVVRAVGPGRYNPENGELVPTGLSPGDLVFVMPAPPEYLVFLPVKDGDKCHDMLLMSAQDIPATGGTAEEAK